MITSSTPIAISAIGIPDISGLFDESGAPPDPGLHITLPDRHFHYTLPQRQFHYTLVKDNA